MYKSGYGHFFSGLIWNYSTVLFHNFFNKGLYGYCIFLGISSFNSSYFSHAIKLLLITGQQILQMCSE